MQSHILLPPDFIQFVNSCKTLMSEVWCYKYNREDFLQFEQNFEAFKKRNLQKFPHHAKVLGSFKKHIKDKPKTKLIYSITHNWHNLTCKKTLVELKSQLTRYQLKRHFLMTQPRICYKSEFLSVNDLTFRWPHHLHPQLQLQQQLKKSQ